MSYLTYFWPIADLTIGDSVAPWAVTANVLTRRGNSRFDLDFSKTGVGEDIAYLRDVAKEFDRPLKKAPQASVVHPWWDNGHPNPWRFFGWAVSDSLLLIKHPAHSFYSFPHVAEMSVLWVVVGVLFGTATRDMYGLWVLLSTLSAIWLAAICMDIWRYMVLDTYVCQDITGFRRAICAVVACGYTNFNELGHACFVYRQANVMLFCRRFDWWFGLHLSTLPTSVILKETGL